MRKFYWKLNDISYELSQQATVPADDTIFAACHYFDGTLTYQGVELFDLGIGSNELWEHWLTKFGDRRIGFSIEDKTDAATKVNAIVQDFIIFNENKYLGMMKALSIEYNPLASYDMTEISGGSQSVADFHTTPATTETTVQSTTYESEQFRNAQKSTSGPTTGSYNNAGYAAENKTLTWTNGDATGDFTTPQANSTSIAKSHKWGTTDRPAQEFLEKEFEIRKWNILDEFFKDLNKETLLSTWN